MTIERPSGQLSGACYDALIRERALAPADRRNPCGFLRFDRLDALEAAQVHVPAIQSDVTRLHVLLLQAASRQLTAGEAKELTEVHDRAQDAAFPTSRALLAWALQFQDLSREHSLSSISASRLRKLELGSFTDATLTALLKELRTAFARVRSLDDSQGFKQAFEIYGEALVYSLLSEHFPTTRITAKTTSLPDFACRLPNGKEFFVELKSFDIVDGLHRSAELHDEAMKQQIDLEEQVKKGRQIATAESELAPYKRAFAKADEYDVGSLITVIDTFIDKARSAFKGSQFVQGPTFAFALCDRLLLPGGKHCVAPHYFERGGGSAVVSGALWHACFGRAGWPISRLPEFEGKPGIEGYLSRDGLLVDSAIPFPTGAIIFAETTGQEDSVLGLYDANWIPGGSWTPDDTEEVMHTLCTASNDKANAFGQLVAMT